MPLRLFFFFFFLPFFTPAQALPTISPSSFEVTENLPVAYQGRFRPLGSTAKLWLYDIYHAQQLKPEAFTAQYSYSSAIVLLWNIHLFGHTPFDDSPLFWIHYSDTKEQLGLDKIKDRFSFNELLIPLQNAISTPHPEIPKHISDEIQQLVHTTSNYQQFSAGGPTNDLHDKTPIATRLWQAGHTLKMLPPKHFGGDWVSLHALSLKIYDEQSNQLVPISNFTAYPDDLFKKIQSTYLQLLQTVQRNDTLNFEQSLSQLTLLLNQAYATIAGKPYKMAAGKSLSYPTLFQLKAEAWYYRLPLIESALVIYGIALILFFASYFITINAIRYSAVATLSIAFLLHTFVLVLRCYVLQRPPVSNMFETVVYVPWIAVAIGSLFYFFTRSRLILSAACLASLILLILLKLTHVDARMENVQAVLDSQYWLIVHVLMVVGSYGAFAVSGILGHLFLISFAWHRKKTSSMQQIARTILYTMYVGVALLIPGTILGGIWAAESWGRFWDWDPKESWAFISACVYLLVIHAYTFNRIRDFGLACGAIGGLIAISFTWYGVNYVLGTGLHSYGFGKGGEGYYFSYLIGETLFLLVMSFLQFKYNYNKKLLE